MKWQACRTLLTLAIGADLYPLPVLYSHLGMRLAKANWCLPATYSGSLGI